MSVTKQQYKQTLRDLTEVNLQHLLFDAYMMGTGQKPFSGKASANLKQMATKFLNDADDYPPYLESHNATPQQHQTATSAENPNETD